jgi:hypothetical protein
MKATPARRINGRLAHRHSGGTCQSLSTPSPSPQSSMGIWSLVETMQQGSHCISNAHLIRHKHAKQPKHSLGIRDATADFRPSKRHKALNVIACSSTRQPTVMHITMPSARSRVGRIWTMIPLFISSLLFCLPLLPHYCCSIPDRLSPRRISDKGASQQPKRNRRNELWVSREN